MDFDVRTFSIFTCGREALTPERSDHEARGPSLWNKVESDGRCDTLAVAVTEEEMGPLGIPIA